MRERAGTLLRVGLVCLVLAVLGAVWFYGQALLYLTTCNNTFTWDSDQAACSRIYAGWMGSIVVGTAGMVLLVAGVWLRRQDSHRP